MMGRPGSEVVTPIYRRANTPATVKGFLTVRFARPQGMETMKALNLIAAVFCLVMLAANADAGCRGRRCRPAANSCQPCQPVANAVHATGNVISPAVHVIGGCVNGVCPANACPGGICR